MGASTARNLWLRTLLLVFICLIANPLHFYGQFDLVFKPPFRIKKYTRLVTATGAHELWGVGGSGNLVIFSDAGRDSRTISTADLCSLFFVDKDIAFISGNNVEILLTTDHGNSWKKQESGTTTDLESIYCVDTKNCWAVGNREGLLLKGGANKKWSSGNIVADGRFSDVYFVNKKSATQ